MTKHLISISIQNITWTASTSHQIWSWSVDKCLNRAPTKKMWKSLKAASCRWTKSKRGIFTQKTMATSRSREISYRSAKTRCKILSSARGCKLLAVCVNLSCLFKNKRAWFFFMDYFFSTDSETSFLRKSAKPRENGSPVKEDESNRFSFWHTIKTPESGINWKRFAAPTNMAGLKNVPEQFVCNMQCSIFDMQDGQTVGWPPGWTKLISHVHVNEKKQTHIRMQVISLGTKPSKMI